MSGWIRVQRRALFEDIAAHGAHTVFVWLRLLAMARRFESQAPFDDARVTLEPGQLITGLEELRGSSRNNRRDDAYCHKTRLALSYLEKTQRIAQATSNHGRLITVLNYKEYQLDVDFDEDRSAGRGAGEPQAERNQSAIKAQLNGQGDKETKEEEEGGIVGDDDQELSISEAEQLAFGMAAAPAVSSPRSRPKKSTKKQKPPAELPEIAKIWNERADAIFPRVISMSTGSRRYRSAVERWEEAPDRAHWERVIDKINASKFLRGEVPGRDGAYFTASIDFLVRPDRATEVLEGKYDRIGGKPGQAQKKIVDDFEQTVRAHLESQGIKA